MINEAKKAIIICDDGVSNRGTVANIIVCDEKGTQGIILPENQLLWDCTNFVVSIGDRFDNGVFSHPDGTNADIYKSPEQIQIDSLAIENDNIKAQNADLAEALLQLQYEKEIENMGGNL